MKTSVVLGLNGFGKARRLREVGGSGLTEVGTWALYLTIKPSWLPALFKTAPPKLALPPKSPATNTSPDGSNAIALPLPPLNPGGPALRLHTWLPDALYFAIKMSTVPAPESGPP